MKGIIEVENLKTVMATLYLFGLYVNGKCWMFVVPYTNSNSQIITITSNNYSTERNYNLEWHIRINLFKWYTMYNDRL